MKQVLIVDDSEQIRERLAALLAESSKIRLVGQAGNGRGTNGRSNHYDPSRH